MADHLESVKGLAAQLPVWAANIEKQGDANSLPSAARWRAQAASLNDIIQELEYRRRAMKPVPASYGDLSDLPPELFSELSGVKVDDLEQQIHSIMNANDGETDIDIILIELFRRFKVIQTRRFIQNKAWRMVQKGLIYSVAGRKGIYSTTAPAEGSPTQMADSELVDDLDPDAPF